MNATRDFRWARSQGGQAHLTMTMHEFREHVEWLEDIAPRDGCTHEWRKVLDKLDPPEVEQ